MVKLTVLGLIECMCIQHTKYNSEHSNVPVLFQSRFAITLSRAGGITLSSAGITFPSAGITFPNAGINFPVLK